MRQLEGNEARPARTAKSLRHPTLQGEVFNLNQKDSPLTLAKVMYLQRTVGNQAVVSLMGQTKQDSVQRMVPNQQKPTAARTFWDLSETEKHVVRTAGAAILARWPGKKIDSSLDELVPLASQHIPGELLEPVEGWFRRWIRIARPVTWQAPASESKDYPGYKRLLSPQASPLYLNQHIGENDPHLASFVKKYSYDTVRLFRGIGIGSFSMPFLNDGVVAGDGYEDIPTFTGSETTRWIPFSDNEATAKNAVFGGIPPRLKVRLSNEAAPVPAGVVVAIDAKNNTPVAYLNAGEQLVRGPISGNNWSTVYLVTISKASVEYVPWSRPLPPAIPWNLEESDYDETLSSLRVWANLHL